MERRSSLISKSSFRWRLVVGPPDDVRRRASYGPPVRGLPEDARLSAWEITGTEEAWRAEEVVMQVRERQP